MPGLMSSSWSRCVSSLSGTVRQTFSAMLLPVCRSRPQTTLYLRPCESVSSAGARSTLATLAGAVAQPVATRVATRSSFFMGIGRFLLLVAPERGSCRA